MAKPVSQITLGIDVAKDELVIADWDTAAVTTIINEPLEIRRWLGSLHGSVRMAIEPTSHYHLALADRAQAAGHKVYLVNPRQLAHYREAVGERHKSDPQDALLLARYLAREASKLRLYEPQSDTGRELWTLLTRRAAAVQSCKQIEQSFQGTRMSIKTLISEYKKVLKRIDRRMEALIKTSGWQEAYQRCLSIPGIGPVNAVALVTAFHRGAFSSQDAFVAYLGLDVRTRESGHYKGKRKLTKKGPAEIRRLLYCAAIAGRSYEPFAQYRQRQLEKGLSKVAANCILARKLARLAFTLMARQENFKKETPAY
jgi:transposase